MKFKYHYLLIAMGISLHAGAAVNPADSLSLKNKVICVDPGHGGTAKTDSYRVGPAGEREEWINLRVAKLLKKKLEARGARVILTRDTDVFVVLTDRAAIAVREKADLFISIHHNATADSAVNFPIIYFHGAGSENLAGVQLGKLLAASFKKNFYQRSTPVSLVADYAIFPTRGSAVLRGTYGIPGVLAEASFFTNPGEEQRLKQSAYNETEAEAYTQAVTSFFKQKQQEIRKENITLTLPPFAVLEEAERTKPVARGWYTDYKKAQELYKKGDSSSLQEAFLLFTRSATSFPDSWVAGDCHRYRSAILKKQGQDEAAETEKRRAKELYLIKL